MKVEPLAPLRRSIFHPLHRLVGLGKPSKPAEKL